MCFSLLRSRRERVLGTVSRCFLWRAEVTSLKERNNFNDYVAKLRNCKIPMEELFPLPEIIGEKSTQRHLVVSLIINAFLHLQSWTCLCVRLGIWEYPLILLFWIVPIFAMMSILKCPFDSCTSKGIELFGRIFFVMGRSELGSLGIWR